MSMVENDRFLSVNLFNSGFQIYRPICSLCAVIDCAMQQIFMNHTK